MGSIKVRSSLSAIARSLRALSFGYVVQNLEGADRSAMVFGSASTVRSSIELDSARSLSKECTAVRIINARTPSVYSGVGAFTVTERSRPKCRKRASLEARGAFWG